MQWLKNRLKERSTWAGLIVLVSMAGVQLSPEQKEMIVTIGTTLVGLVMTFTADTKPTVQINEPAPESQRIVTPDLTAEQRAEMGLD